MLVRKAHANDFQNFLDLRRDSILALAKGFYTPEQLHDWAHCASGDRIRALIAAGQFFVGEEAGALVCGGAWVEGRVGHLYVAPAHSGQGLGKILLSYIEADYRAVTGRDDIEADASLNARAFYESQGYVYVETGSVENNGISSEYCLLRKAFSSL